MTQHHLQTDTEEDKILSDGKCLTPFQRKLLQKALQDNNLSKKYRQRIQIMLLTDEGKHITEICRELGCSHITVRNWSMIAYSGQAHNWKSSPLGRPKSVSSQYLERLKELVSHSPKEIQIPGKSYTYPIAHWTAKKLSQHLKAELGIQLSDRHINRLLKDMGLATRQLSSNLPENTDDENLVIGDLSSVQVSDVGDWWTFQPFKISTIGN